MILGIDLGTTNSLAAVWRDGKPELVPNSLGDMLTPSCVSIDEDGSILVGKAALERAQTHADRTARAFKRHIGTNKSLKLAGKMFRAEELSALVLQSLKADAEAALGTTFTEAIVTVPAYFSDAQRKATRIAGQMAGLRVDRLLNEPTAAALACGIHQRNAETKFLVFDLGGGTFDISILEMFDGVMEVRASAGDNFLGGEDFTDALVEKFLTQHSLSSSLKRDPRAMERLAAQAEIVKRELSIHPRSTMKMQIDDRDYALEVTEALAGEIFAPLLQRLRAPVERALRDANFRTSELDSVVLAGGATRMPLIRKLVTSMFGRFPSIEFNPDEIVALGAAVQAGLKAKDAALDEMVMTDVSPYSLGVGISKRVSATIDSHGHFDPIIERNSPVPISRVKTYVPMQAGQATLTLQIYQGEGRLVQDNIHLGDLSISLPSLPPEESSVDVRFTYDVNGILQVEAQVQKTGDRFELIVEGNPGLLSEAEIEKSLQSLAKLKIHPRDMMENRALLARAERTYQQLKGEARTWLADQILQFETALGTQATRQIAPARKLLEAQLDEIDRDSRLFLDPGEGRDS